MATKIKTFSHPIIRSNSNDYIDGSYFNVELAAEISSEVKDSIHITYSIDLNNKCIEDLVRNMTNKKNGNHSIKNWLTLMGKKDKFDFSNEKFSLKKNYMV
jgi:hypothetical protein